MYKVIHNSGKSTTFNTQEEAQKFYESKGRAKCFFKIEKVKESVKKNKASWKLTVDFTDAINVNRENVKNFYNKAGYIKVIDSVTNTVKHIGRTKNMGKVFSNYINCDHYKQSYDFNLNTTDKLYFKESELN